MMIIDTHTHLVPPISPLPSAPKPSIFPRSAFLHDPLVLRFVLSITGADRIMLGSDMPFLIGDRSRRGRSPPRPASPAPRSSPSLAGWRSGCSGFVS